MMEYTLVFRRTVIPAATARAAARRWEAVRPAMTLARRPRSAAASLAQVFIVPVCSALGMDGPAYDRFLIESGAVAAALLALAAASVEQPDEADDARKEIQALVMAAEVQHIVNQLSA